MPEGFRELAPDDEVIPFAKGEIPATYGGPMGSSPKGFRELAQDEEFIPLKPPEPSLMERATGAVKSAASTVKNALPAMPSIGSTSLSPKPNERGKQGRQWRRFG